MNKLHSGAKWKFRLGAYGSMIIPLVVITYAFNFVMQLIFVLRASKGGDPIAFSTTGFFIALAVGIVVFIILSEIYVSLAYKNWKYEFTDMNLKLERGVIWKKYSNIPYERVQNVDIHRGVLARMLGFSTVDIQTAGAAYSARGMSRSEGHIPAVDIASAEKIRDFLMSKISKKSSGGM